jgi:Ser/Thr protein kinase RdoA (MazF antagonist)
MQPKPTLADLGATAGQFAIPGVFLGAKAYGNGHINDTFAAVFDQDGTQVRYILQCINADIFKEPLRLMENVANVTRHIRARLEAAGAPEVVRRVLTLVDTWSGGSCHVDDAGRVWRCYLFVEGASTYEIIQSPGQAWEAARAFGAFQRHLADYAGPRLFETIPRFHHTRSRFEALRQAVAADRSHRAAGVQDELRFAFSRESLADSLLTLQEAGGIPERITHNDTKLNNILLDDRTGEGICVLDLDTVMPGLSLYDFGDMVRTATNPVAEDERDLARVQVQEPMFEALARGYLEGAGGALLPAEKERLVLAGQLLTYENGLRFLTDHLEGDHYFRIHREGHNLDRCRNQFALLRSLEDCEERLTSFVMGLG